MSEEKIQRAFSRIKEDMLFLQQEITILKQEIQELKYGMDQILRQFKQFLPSKKSSNTYPTHIQHMKRVPTHNLKNQALILQNFHSSIGNRGVPTDSQQTVNKQINELKRTFGPGSIPKESVTCSKLSEPQELTEPVEQAKPAELAELTETEPTERIATQAQIARPIARTPKPEPQELWRDPWQTPNQIRINFPKISNIVTSMKQELQDKFKKLTKQEFLVFSILYTLEEEKGNVTYRDIATRANLAESSVRDYISRLEHKGIPLVKERINNKTIVLRVSPELRNIATLDSLSKLVKF